jgi:hypothetical protein
MSIHREDDLHPLVFVGRIENLRGHLTLGPKLLSTARWSFIDKRRLMD